MAKRRSRSLDLPKKRVYKLVEGEVLRFRDKNGRLTKFDARKKLTTEIWFQGKKTGRTLNKISKGKIIPQKFESRSMKNRLFQQKSSRASRRPRSEVESLTITIDARLAIADNLESKADKMLSSIVKFTKRKLVTSLSIDFQANGTYHSINTYIRGLNKGQIALEISRYIIARLYAHKLRMSGIKKSDLGDRAKYVRSLRVKFQYNAQAFS